MQIFIETLSFYLFLFGNQMLWVETESNLRTNGPNVNSSAHPYKSPFLLSNALPVETTFSFPGPLPTMLPSGGNFSKGIIDLGGLEVMQVSVSNSTSQRVWRTFEGGQENMGFSIFEPINLSSNFSKLGFYAQPNNRLLFGWILVARDVSGTSLRPPVDYTEVGNTASLNIKQDGLVYFWQPVCLNGYQAIGLFVTSSPQKPPLGRQESISCVLSNLTEQSEADTWIWGIKGISVFSLRAVKRGAQATGVYTGTFSFQQRNSPLPSLFCLKNMKFDLSSMPSEDQTRVLFQAYSPWIYFHPKEDFLPSSVNWFFGNGALLYQKGNEYNPVPIQPNGSNLPQSSCNDDLFWLDYPDDENAKEKIKRGDIGNTKVYLHIKPVRKTEYKR